MPRLIESVNGAHILENASHDQHLSMNLSLEEDRRLVLCERTIEYREDFGTGRCRVSHKMQLSLGVRVQAVVQIRVGSIAILCVVFPDTQEALEEDEICVDATVFVNKLGDTHKLETATSCVIETVFPRALCSAVHASPYDLDVLSLGDLPVKKGCVIRANESLGRNKPIAITEVRHPYPRVPGSPAVAIVHIDTIVIPTRAPPSIESGESEALSVTTAVKEVITGLVTPAVSVPAAAQPSGVLLTGPPGVGKTHSVKVAAGLCKPWCAVKVVDLNIPNILADDDPIGKMKALLEEAEEGTEGYPEEGEEEEGALPAPSPSAKRLSYESPSKKEAAPSFSPLSSSSSSFSFLTPSPERGKAQSTLLTASGNGSDSTSAKNNEGKRKARPQLCLVMLDEADALGTVNSESEVQRAVKSTLCAWLDNRQRSAEQNHGSGSGGGENGDSALSTRRVCFVATSNRADSVDPRLRRGGRLEREVVLAPRAEDRQALLTPLLTRLVARTEGGGEKEEGLEHLVKEVTALTGGYVAADIVSLVAKAGELSTSTSGGGVIPALRESLWRAMQLVGPSCLRGAAIRTPNLGYDDVVGYSATKKSLQRALRACDPSMAETMAKFGLQSPGGILLHGPPGNSKTRLILAAASSHRLPVISLTAADVFSPYVGDAEEEVRKAFTIARQASPCVLFFDELDAFVTNRGTGSGSGGGSDSTSSVEARVLATLLTEMDGIGGSDGSGSGSSSGGVMVMAATNRLGAVDPALLRKGRFHQVIEVPLPDAATRSALLAYFAGKCQVGEARVTQLAALLKEGQSGADIENLCREEQVAQMRRILRKGKGEGEGEREGEGEGEGEGGL